MKSIWSANTFSWSSTPHMIAKIEYLLGGVANRTLSFCHPLFAVEADG